MRVVVSKETLKVQEEVKAEMEIEEKVHKAEMEVEEKVHKEDMVEAMEIREFILVDIDQVEVHMDKVVLLLHHLWEEDILEEVQMVEVLQDMVRMVWVLLAKWEDVILGTMDLQVEVDLLSL